MEYEYHDACLKLPSQSKYEFDELVESMRRSGYDSKFPIILYDGKILDGRHRYKAAMEAGVTPVFTEWKGENPYQAVRDWHSGRRADSWNATVRYLVFRELDEIAGRIADEKRKAQEEANKARSEAAKEGRVGRASQKQEEFSAATSSGTTKPSRSADKAAEATGTNRGAVQVGEFIITWAPDLVDKVKNGKLSASGAKKEAKKRKKQYERKEYENQLEQQETVAQIPDDVRGWHRLGSQYLYCGNNLDDAFTTRLPHARLAFADPPYNAGVDEWDIGFVWKQDYLQEAADIVCVTPGGWNAYEFYRQTEMKYIWELSCWIKNGMTHGRCGYANWIKTSIFGKLKPNIEQDFFHITIDIGQTDETSHKGRKPEKYMYHIIKTFTEKGDYIIDPFAGSGQTLIVSEKAGRVSYNAEVDSQFVRDIIRRSMSIGIDYEQL